MRAFWYVATCGGTEPAGGRPGSSGGVEKSILKIHSLIKLRYIYSMRRYYRQRCQQVCKYERERPDSGQAHERHEYPVSGTQPLASGTWA